ncbi:MAG: hypothetical protein D6704_13145 [Nitrospirae bacterium]|nr:MAG: hypothetical protein D6704_13145 [Nitrospirota bacterium]
MNSIVRPALLISRSLAQNLLHLYDYPHPQKPGVLIPGYDKPHALRTAKMCAAVALAFRHSLSLVRQYQIACLLHDLGRYGLDPPLFGRIWSWARRQGIPTRPAEWRAVHPDTPYGKETEAFLARYRASLEASGIPMDQWACEQVEMRLGFARRLRRRLREVRPILRQLGVSWAPWMQHIMLYYYYPEVLQNAPAWVRQFGEILVGCEQLEAYSNRRRGRDYYARPYECFAEAFTYLKRLYETGILGHAVLTTIQFLAAQGVFDRILAAARGEKCLSPSDQQFLRTLLPSVDSPCLLSATTSP